MKGFLIEYEWIDITHGEFHTSYFWAHNNRELTGRRNTLQQQNFQWKNNGKKVADGFSSCVLIPMSYTLHEVEL